MAQIYQKVFFEIRIVDVVPTIWDKGTPSFKIKNSGNVLPL